ncbi:MAG: hypothetical protein AB1758_17875 [Candidatus Eremiobacterota bacterium]
MSPWLGRAYMEALRLAGPDRPERLRVTRPPRALLGRGALRLVAVRGREWVLAYEGYILKDRA